MAQLLIPLDFLILHDPLDSAEMVCNTNIIPCVSNYLNSICDNNFNLSVIIVNIFNLFVIAVDINGGGKSKPGNTRFPSYMFAIIL